MLDLFCIVYTCVTLPILVGAIGVCLWFIYESKNHHKKNPTITKIDGDW